uniref:ApoA-I-binding protein 2 n=1 Tax=Takifugu rubripes TaxID=31033 RepID=H2VAZ0_TAKRU
MSIFLSCFLFSPSRPFFLRPVPFFSVPSLFSPSRPFSFHPVPFLSAPPPPLHQAYPLSSLGKKQPTVLVICGPEQNGSIGLVCARHLRMFEYEPTIYLPKRSTQSLHQDFTVQCEKMDIPFLSYLPTEVQLINDAYNLLIDAMLGPEADCSNIKEPYSGILVTLKQVNVPIVSVDVPSGWDAEEPSQGGISPDVLISLTAPKKCAMSFSGKHFLAGRFLPYDIQKKYELNIPEYPGTDCTIEL